MRARLGNHLLTLAAIAGLLALHPPSARAHHIDTHNQNPSPPSVLSAADVTITAFATGSLLIPMDQCHQRTNAYVNNTDLTYILQDTYDSASATIRTQKRCQAGGDDGMILAYSMVQRLVQAGIKVHWALRPGKTTWHDYDVEFATQPMRWNRGGSDTALAAVTGTLRYAGAPFIIDAADAAAAKALINAMVASYAAVDLHVAQAGFTAPVFSTMTAMPKLALIDGAADATLPNQQTNKLFGTGAGSVEEALMNDMIVPAAGAWIEIVTPAQVRAGYLATNNFVLAWIPPFDFPTGSSGTANQLQFLQKLGEFADVGGNVLFQDGGIGSAEGWGTGTYAVQQTTFQYGGFQTRAATCATVGGCTSPSGIATDGAPSSSWGNGSSPPGGQEGMVSSDYSDPASQFGGGYWTGIGGSKYLWKPRLDQAYAPGVRRMVYTDQTSNLNHAADRFDAATWRHKDNDLAKGRIYYLGGDHWRRTTAAGFRLLLNTVFVHAAKAGAATEVSRSNPIIATVGTPAVEAIVQGTYEYPFPTRTQVTAPGHEVAFRYPYIQGHLRARELADIGAAGNAFDDGAVTTVFDAKDGLPAATFGGCATDYTVACRTVWTTTVGTDNPPNVILDSTTASAVGAIMTTGLAAFTAGQLSTLVSRIVAGNETSPGVFAPKLGGVDRSTVAIIPPSLVAGGDRPTMVYFGGTDGMLHAVCAEDHVASGCLEGKELWAYIPRLLLQELRTNTAIIDGSPRVLDLFGDFDQNGSKEFRTVLMIHTGTGIRATGRTPAVYALDVTDPKDPKVLWEHTMNVASARAYELGMGQALAAGIVMIGGVRKNVVFAQTNNGKALADAGGTPGAGPEANVVVAIDIDNGDELWATTFDFPDPVRNAANAVVPWQGVPGGAVGIDKTGYGVITELVYGTLYGDLWLVDPVDGASRYGTGPLFRFTEDYKPVGAAPALYSDAGVIYAVGVTGSYWDRSGAALWNGSATQHGFAVSLSTPTTTPGLPLDEGDAGTANVPFVKNFGGGEKLSSQAVVVGEEVFFATETGDINASTYGTGSSGGKAYGVNLTGTTTNSDTTVVAGVGSIASSGTSLYQSGAKGSEKLSFSAASTTGEAVNNSTSKLTRRLWLRTL